jgi:hypothetical protein
LGKKPCAIYFLLGGAPGHQKCLDHCACYLGHGIGLILLDHHHHNTCHDMLADPPLNLVCLTHHLPCCLVPCLVLFINDGFGVAEESLEKKYEGAGMCYSQDGLTFLNIFDANGYAEYREDNLFYPFTSKEEWEISDFLLYSSLSMAAIGVFLKLPLASTSLCTLQN